MSASPRMVGLGCSNRAPLADASWAGVYSFDRLMRVLPSHHGSFCVGAYVLVGKSFGVSVTYGLAIGAVVFDDLVRASVLVVAKKQNHHYGDLHYLFHLLCRMDLDWTHAAGLMLMAFVRNGRRI